LILRQAIPPKHGAALRLVDADPLEECAHDRLLLLSRPVGEDFTDAAELVEQG